MSRSAAVLLAVAALALPACDRAGRAVAPNAMTQALNKAVEARLGGTGTCVVLLDTATGEARYQYGRYTTCTQSLPPCATAQIPAALAAVDAGAATAATVFKWDGSAQPVSAWERDSGLGAAFAASVPWLGGQLVRAVGEDRYRERLKAFGYGDGLRISPRDQAAFLHRLYAGKLPVKAASAAVVQGFMPARNGAGGKAAACNLSADGARTVGWWVGRVQGAKGDYVFAASMEGEGALPGVEVESRARAAFADAGLIPRQ